MGCHSGEGRNPATLGLLLQDKVGGCRIRSGMTTKTYSAVKTVVLNHNEGFPEEPFQAACPAAIAPVQDDPCPAVQTKQWSPVTILLVESAA